MKVSTLNRLFTIAALWDLVGHVHSRDFDSWCDDCAHGRCFTDSSKCGPGTAMRNEIARRDAEDAKYRNKIDDIALDMGVNPSNVFIHVRSAVALTQENTREGRRARRIMRKSYARVS